MSEPRPGVALLRNLALSAVSLLAFALLSETVLTLFWHPEGGWLSPGITDAYVGFRLRPRNTWREAGGAMVRTNSLGFRDREITRSPAPGCLRILCLGDSSTFGYGVRPQETYSVRLARALDRRLPGRCIEVINTGVPGWASANGAAFLAREGIYWKPDVVLISFGYNEQLGSGREVFHYDYDSRLRRVLIHRLGEIQLRMIPEPNKEPIPEAQRMPGRFENFPRNLLLYRFTKFILDATLRLPIRLKGAVKSSHLASWILARVYARNPERILTRLRVDVEGNHVLGAYEDALEDIVKTARAADARPVIILQPRRAYREFLDWLPEHERTRNLRAVDLIRGGKPGMAIAILEPLRKADPSALITAWNLSVAYRMAGRSADADHALDAIISIRSFTMNAVADRTAGRLGVPVVYTPLAFEASTDPNLFFPDRYHTRAAGYRMVAKEVEKTLVQQGLLEKAARVPASRGQGDDVSGGVGVRSAAIRMVPYRERFRKPLQTGLAR